MVAPMSEQIKQIMTDPRKSKAFTAMILAARKKGVDPKFKVGGKWYRLSRVTSLSPGK